jgi:hypothetical protein
MLVAGIIFRFGRCTHFLRSIYIKERRPEFRYLLYSNTLEVLHNRAEKAGIKLQDQFIDSEGSLLKQYIQ